MEFVSQWILPHASKCAIPVFDGLLPEPHNRRVLQLLFLMAQWHSLAKLCLHTDISLAAMDCITVLLGDKLRLFQKKTCAVFSTRELNRERDARVRRQSSKVQSIRPTATLQLPQNTDSATARSPTAAAPRPGPSVKSSTTPNHELSMTPPIESSEASARHGSPASPPDPSRRDGGRRQKTFNLNTYKFHALGDYAATIRQFGTTDSYTTEMVCPSHTPSVLLV